MKPKLIVLISIMTTFLFGCKFTNIPESSPSLNEINGVTMEIKDGSLSRIGATIIITDSNDKEKNTYGINFRLDRKVEDSWTELKELQSPDWTMKGYYVDKNHKLVMEQNWEDIYGQLENGNYRLVKYIIDKDTGKNKYFSVEFTIS